MFLNVDPEMVEAAAGDVSRIGTVLDEAAAYAAGPTTAVLPAGADEVSVMISTLFGGHATQFQQVAAQAQVFHQRFATNLAAAGNAYAQAEQAAAQTLRNAVTAAEQPLTRMMPPPPTPTAPLVPTNSNVGLIIGGTGSPFSPKFMSVGSMYLPNSINSLLYTPEQAWPLTPNLGGLTLTQSINQGAGLLDAAIRTQVAAGNHVTVWSESQSSLVSTQEIRNLIAQGSPFQKQLSFILTGDPANPDGGFFERFTGLNVPLVDWHFNGATPPNSPYQTAIYTNQYDPVSDFPKYPLNVISDLNSVAGMAEGQHNYLLPRTYTQLPTSPNYAGNTTYWMALDNQLPLVEPLRMLGSPGNALADLLQPDLRVLVDMGYGTGDYANLPTPAQIGAIPNPAVVLPDLAAGAVQGVHAVGVDAGLLPHSMFPNAYPYLPTLDPGLNFPTGQPPTTGISRILGLT